MKKTLITLAALTAASVANATLLGEWNFENELGQNGQAYGEPTYTESVNACDLNVPGSSYMVSTDMGTGIAVTGKTSYVKLVGDGAYCDAMKLTKSFTLSSYVNFSAGFSDIAAIFGTGSNSSAGLAVGIKASGSGYTFDLLNKSKWHGSDNNSDAISHMDTITALTADTWHHVALSYSYDAEAGTGTATWYLNGSVAATQSITNTSMSETNTAGSAIGNTSVDTFSDFDGSLKLDKVQLFDTALTQAEIVTAAGLMTIPEPTTATLSLLALAGLAARRRRK